MISATLTVIKEFGSTTHFPNGVQQSVVLQATDGLGNVSDDDLSVVLLANLNGTIQEVSTYISGTIACTKITNRVTGQSAYVAQIYWDVLAAQHPCCSVTGIIFTVTATAGSINAGTMSLAATTYISSGSVSTTQWTITTKPSGANPVIANAALLNTSVSGMTVPGNYVFTFTATAADGSTASATANVNIPVPITYDTVLSFISSDTATGGGITGTITPGATSNIVKVEFNAIPNTTGLPVDLSIYKGSVSAQNFIVDLVYPAEYGPQEYRITYGTGEVLTVHFSQVNNTQLLP